MTATATAANITATLINTARALPRGTEPAEVAVENPQVGDIVWAFSRGNWRVTRIAKVGRVNVTVEYATEGGIKDATERYHSALAALVTRDQVEDQVRNSYTPEGARKNHAYNVKQMAEVEAGTYSTYGRYSNETMEEANAREIAKIRAIAALTVEEYVEAAVQRETDRILADNVSRREIADTQGLGGFVAITSKAVKKGEIRAL